MEEKKEKKIAALLRKSDTTQQTAVQVVSQNNLSSDKITENKSEVGTEELATRVSGVEALIPKIDVKIGRVSKKVDNLKSSTNKKFERITKEIDIVAEGIDSVNKKTTKLSTLIEKQKGDGKKDSKKSEKGNNKIITILTNMLDFMKLTYEQDTLAREQQNNFSEEQKFEKERRDKELLDALKGRSKPTAEKIDDKGKSSFLEKILGAMASILGPLKTFMSLIGTLFSTLSKVLISITKFIGNAGKILFNASRLLFSSLGVGLLAAAAAGYGLYKLYEYINKNDQSKLSPSEAAAALSSEQEVIAQAKRKFKTNEVTKEQIEETRKELTENVTGGRKRAEEIKAMPEGPEKEKALQSIGGARKLEEIISDKKEYKVPTGNEVEALPDNPIPRPNQRKNPMGANLWDKKWKGTLDPVTGKQLTPPAAPSTSGSSEEGMKNYKGRSSSPAAPAATPVTPAPKEIPAPVSSATPITNTSNLGTQMATMSNENALTKTVEELAVATSSQVNNVMAATKSIVEHTMDKIPSVRNQEETFQRMIFNSTRVV